MIDIRLLGPLEASDEGRPLPLPSGKPAALLARLALEPGRVVAAGELVEALWGEEPPSSAPKVLQAHVSRLRKLLGADRIATRPPGYALQAARDEIDLGRFERLTAEAATATAPARRAELLQAALRLWRGPPLAEFRTEPFAVPAGRRIAELRLGALEARFETELELGQHARLVPELEAAVADEPLREPLRAALMLALYRSGRQAEALDRYRAGRRLLVEQLGIAPSPTLQDLERAILRQDSRLDEHRRAAPSRGAVIGARASLGGLLAPLCADGRELLLVEIGRDLAAATARLEAARAGLADTVALRTACFTSASPAEDLARLAAEQGAELLVVAAPSELPAELATAFSCDVALAARADRPLPPDGPVLVPFGGDRDEWAAVELGAWLARSYARPLHLLGVHATGGRRDASRTLAGAALALQRFAGVVAEPVLIPPGPDGIVAQAGAAVVASLPAGDLDATRRALLEGATVPVLLVRRGLRPGGLAPSRTLTRFSWSLPGI